MTMAALVQGCTRRLPTRTYGCCLACVNVRSHTSSTSQVQYPRIKPKYPEGSWYSFSPKQAWSWYEDVEAIDKLPTVAQRLYENHGCKYQLYYSDVKPFLTTPGVLSFQEEITKSYLHSELSTRQSKVDISANRWASIASDVKDVVMDEYKHFKRQADKSATKQEWEVSRRRMVIGHLLNRLLAHLSADLPQLFNSDLDNNVNVQTHWARGGEKTPSDAFAQVMYKCGVIRYGYWQNVDFQLRSCLPLSTKHIGGVDSLNKPLDPTPPPEALHCYHEAFEAQRKKLNEQLRDYNPDWRALERKCYSLPHQAGVHYGTPADFVTMSVVSPSVADLDLKSRLSEEDYTDCVTGAGLTHSFAVSHALAHYHGYDMHHDLTQPLLTQTIVTDGKEFTCITHQLNTLRLFVHDIDNDKYNGYSRGETMKLYHQLDDNGEIIGFNNECVKMIGQCMLARLADSVPANPHFEQEPVKAPSSGDLLPYLPTYNQYASIPDLDEGSVQIPTFIRFTRGDDPLSEWDLSTRKRMQRFHEKKHEIELTKGPFHDSFEPPARGKTVLDRHFAQKRRAEREKRIKWRDAVLAAKQAEDPKSNE